MKSSIKTKFAVQLICLVVAVVVGWGVLRPKKLDTIDSMASDKNLDTEVLPRPSIPTTPVPAVVDPEIVQPFARTPFLGLKDPRWRERGRLRKESPGYEWRTPIAFYGKVIDELEQPVAGATVEFAWSGTVEKYGGDGGGKRTIKSDTSGLFNITGVEGKGMIVYVSKEGYHRRSESNGWFEYAGFWEPTFIEPDRNNPVIFRLITRSIAEPTLRVRQRSLPKLPALQTHIDLLAEPSELLAGGDIKLQIIRPPNPGYQNLFDWQLKIEGQGDSEIIMSEEEFMLRAPDDGYQKVFSKDYKQVRGNNIETVKFYVRNKARKLYAAISVEITPYYPNHITKEDAACFIVTGTVNPNDSPNLEYDPEKNIREMAKKRNR